MRSRPWPTPEQIAHTPELAILCALDGLLEIARRALIAVHPVLGDTDTPYWAGDRNALDKAARVLIARSETLHRAIRTYEAASNELSAQNNDDSDLPF